MVVPLLLLIILGVDWASGYAIAGYVMRHGVGPYAYAFWQSVGPLICLLIIQVCRQDVFPTAKSLKYALGCGLFGLAIPNLLIYFACVYVPSGILTILANTSSLFVYPLALLLGQERFKIGRLLMVILGCGGILMLIIPIHMSSVSLSNFNYGNFWLYFALFIPFCYAFAAVYIARFRPNSGNILNHALWMLVVSSVVVIPLAVFGHEFYYLSFKDLNSWLIFAEILLSSLGYILLFILIKMVGPVYYSLVNAIAALSGVVYGRVIFQQSFTFLTYMAISIILIAISGLTYFQRRKI